MDNIGEGLRRIKEKFEAPGYHGLNITVDGQLAGRAAKGLTRILEVGKLAEVSPTRILEYIITVGVLHLEGRFRLQEDLVTKFLPEEFLQQIGVNISEAEKIKGYHQLFRAMRRLREAEQEYEEPEFPWE